jgi:hypothetical protein
MDDEEEMEDVPLEEGMPVENADGEKLGELGALLVEEDEDEAEFLVLRAAGADRLVPFAAVLGVGDGSLVLDVPADNVAKFPRLAPDAEPTEAQMDAAYEVFDSGASEAPDEDEDAD